MSMLYRVLIDTCIWLDLANSYRSAPLVRALNELCDNAQLEIVVPDLVSSEFARNKERVLQESLKSLQTHVRIVRQAIPTFADERSKQDALDALDKINFASSIGASQEMVEQVQALMSHSENILMETTTLHRAMAAQRALHWEAPCHRDRNNIADAILIEVYNELTSGTVSDHVSFGFATTNYRDFSDPRGDNRQPHPALASTFSERSLYITDIAQFVERCDPSLLRDVGAMYDLAPDFRSLSDLNAEEERLSLQVWYNRHMGRVAAIESGRIKVLPESEYSRDPYKPHEILNTIWEGALNAAKEVEKRYGIESLGPWDDFEWGMINGKLSALRWVLGYEWDMLDT
jgi:predicted nucleic acid-binding protein